MHFHILKLANDWRFPPLALSPLDSEHMVGEVFAEGQVLDGWFGFQLIRVGRSELQIFAGKIFNLVKLHRCLRMVPKIEENVALTKRFNEKSCEIGKSLPRYSTFLCDPASPEKLPLYDESDE